MKKRESRLSVIKNILLTNEVRSQDELLHLLEKDGYDLTQATLSRDLRQLKVAKIANGEGKYFYAITENKNRMNNNIHYANTIVGRGFLSLNFSGNIAVIRTLPGYASSMAYHIDNQSNGEILGTIAGDDTIMLVLHEDAILQSVYDHLKVVLSTF